MADAKITALPDLGGTPDAADQLYVVDVSDTTDDPAGSSKRVSFSDLVAGASSGGSPDQTSYTVGVEYATLDLLLAYLDANPVPRDDTYDITINLPGDATYNVTDYFGGRTNYPLRFQKSGGTVDPIIDAVGDYIFLYGRGKGVLTATFDNVQIGTTGTGFDLYDCSITLLGTSRIWSLMDAQYWESATIYSQSANNIVLGSGAALYNVDITALASDVHQRNGTGTWESVRVKAVDMLIESGSRINAKWCDFRLSGDLNAANPLGNYPFALAAPNFIQAATLNLGGSTGTTDWDINGATVNAFGGNIITGTVA